MVFGLKKKRKDVERIRVKFEIASVFVMLANPELGLHGLTEKLSKLEDRGYNFNTRFRANPQGIFSRDLNSFIGGLEMGGYTYGGFSSLSSLNDSGRELLEKEVAEYFASNPTEARRFAESSGLDLDSVLAKSIRKYVSREEERVHGKRYTFPED